MSINLYTCLKALFVTTMYYLVSHPIKNLHFGMAAHSMCCRTGFLQVSVSGMRQKYIFLTNRTFKATVCNFLQKDGWLLSLFPSLHPSVTCKPTYPWLGPPVSCPDRKVPSDLWLQTQTIYSKTWYLTIWERSTIFLQNYCKIFIVLLW